MSAAELHRGQLMIRFVWGGCCDVLPGQVRTCHYDYNKMPQNHLIQTTETAAARKYWKSLIASGFRQTGDPLDSICPDDLLISRHLPL